MKSKPIQNVQVIAIVGRHEYNINIPLGGIKEENDGREK